MDICVICNREVKEENASVLEIGAYGNPKYLCEECSSELDTITLGTDLEGIASAMERLGKKMADTDASGRTYAKVSAIMERAADRARKIKDGTYDFSLDDADDIDEDGFDEVPEELLETEEDRELDRKDEEKAEKFNEIFDYVALGAAIALVGFFIWKLIDIFLLK